MPDYELDRLSTRSFEHLVQALAMKVFGEGLSVFGDGPDGQREATFDGPTDYLTDGTIWDGYTVIQAKFRQRPEGTFKDGRWALANLQKELDGWRLAQTVGDRRMPDAFLYVTNVVLSPKEGTGALDKAKLLLSNAAKELGLKAWDVWHYDKIRALLDNNASVRTQYSAFISSGDVLSKAAKALDGLTPDFDEHITSYLGRELLADQYARLSQTGAVDENHVPLANIFVDLPIASPSEMSGAGPDPEDDPFGAETADRRFAAEVISVAAERFDGWSLSQRPQPSGSEPRLLHTGRCVLVGGPGQGKTTLGQFLCQVFRAKLLSSRPMHTLSIEIKAAVDEVKRQSEEEKLNPPSALRFPVRIILPTLADALAKGQVRSLVEYIAALIGTSTASTLTAAHVLTWMRAYPCLLVLDGLDEVPWSSNRSEVLETIKHFWAEVAQVGADVLAVVTTRPQGYTEEFSPTYYEHMHLTPLKAPDNLHCASRLIRSQHSADEPTAARLMHDVTEAAMSPSTARLMISPLQIHILTVLIERSGPPPEDRYTLFRDYYSVIYQREQGKLGLPASSMLREHRADIDVIHHRVGLLLQSRGAGLGETEARLSNSDFNDIVRIRLEHVGWQGAELDELCSRIMTIALERLVLIVPAVKGYLGFEVRSLQEYLAAEALTTGSDDEVKRRLREIATRSYWRNVFLLAVGKCRLDREHLIDSILGHLASLNARGPGSREQLDRLSLSGSTVALTMLEDAAFTKGPRYLRLLCEQALRLLSVPPGDWTQRLAVALPTSTDDLTEASIRQALNQNGDMAAAAWLLCAELVSTDREWPLLVLRQEYTSGDAATRRLVLSVGISFSNVELLSLIGREILSCVEPSEAAQIFHMLADSDSRDRVNNAPFIRALQHVLSVGSSSHRDAPISVHLTAVERSEQAHGSGISVGFVPASLGETYLRSLDTVFGPLSDDVPKVWRPLAQLIEYAEDPSARTLRSVARQIFGTDMDGVRLRMPWPIAATLHWLAEDSERLAILDQIDLGELPEWLAAEDRWTKTGIYLEEVIGLSSAESPINSRISQVGSPPTEPTSWSISHGLDRTAPARTDLYLRAAIDVALSSAAISVPAAYSTFLLWCAAMVNRRGGMRKVELELPEGDFVFLLGYVRDGGSRRALNAGFASAIATLAYTAGYHSDELFDELDAFCERVPADNFLLGSITREATQLKEWLVDGAARGQGHAHLVPLIASVSKRGDVIDFDLGSITTDPFARLCCELRSATPLPSVERVLSLLHENLSEGRSLGGLANYLSVICAPIDCESAMQMCGAFLEARDLLDYVERGEVFDLVSQFVESEPSLIDDVAAWPQFGLSPLATLDRPVGRT